MELLCPWLSDPGSFTMAVPPVCLFNFGDVRKHSGSSFCLNVQLNRKSFLNSRFFFSSVCFKSQVLLHISLHLGLVSIV